VRTLLVAGQIAGSLVLLIVAALFARDLRRAGRLDLGFEPARLLNAVMDPQWAGYDTSRTNAFYDELERRVARLPGVDGVGMAFSVPLGYYGASGPVHVDDRPTKPDEQPPTLLRNIVGPSYFETMRMPLVRGRAFAAADAADAAPVAIINETMADLFWPGEDPIGRQFRVDAPGNVPVQIVGVARDSRYSTLWESPQPYFYLPLSQWHTSMRALQVRSSTAPEAMAAAIRNEVQALGPDVPIIDVRTMEDTIGGFGGLMLLRIGATQATAMGLLGLLLAVIGVYGVTSYATSRRIREIGIRMALGAAPGDVLRLVMRQGAMLIAAGVAAGLAAALGVSRVLSVVLRMEDAVDPLVFAGVTLLLAATALGACGLPARRALRVAPTVALRHE
jgi:predicted permease